MKTVKVRIAMAVDSEDDWNSCGPANLSDTSAMGLATEILIPGESRYWIEVELPVPEVKTITNAKVTKDDN